MRLHCWIYSIIPCFLMFLESQCYADMLGNLRSLDTYEGKQLTWQCPVKIDDINGHEVQWFYQGDLVPSFSQNSRRYQADTTLYIDGVDRNEDSGKFKCTITNSATGASDSTAAKLNIQWTEINNIQLQSPENIIDIVPGINVTLKCDISSNPRPKSIVWEKDGAALQRGSAAVGSHSRRVLTIENVTLEDNGSVYKCCATIKSQQVCTVDQQQQFQLSVRDESVITFTRVPEDVTIKRSSSVWLHCQAVSDPPPTIKWYKDYKEIANRTNKITVFPNGTLYVGNLRSEKTYRCSASNGNAKSADRIAKVSIASIKPFDRQNQYFTKYFDVSENIEHYCNQVASNPTATLTWMKGDTIIETRSADPDSSRKDPRVVQIISTNAEGDQLSSILVINSAIPGDEGNYTCMASNIANNVTMDYILILAVKPVLGNLDNKYVKEGENVTWTCDVRKGQPPPMKISWTKDGDYITNEPGKLVISGHNLTVMSVDPADQARYSCEAGNSAGTTTSGSAQLQIEERLKFSPPLQDTCVGLNEVTNISCNAGGSTDPNPVVKWTKVGGSAAVPKQTTINATTTVLIFDNPTQSDEGTYRCHANDASASITDDIKVQVVRKPEIIHQPDAMYTSQEGSSILLPCGSNSPKLSVVWTHTEKEIVWRYEKSSKSSSPHIKVFANGSLYLEKLHPTMNSGAYECSYQVCRFTATAQTKLVVIEKPIDDYSNNDDTDAEANTQKMVQKIAFAICGAVIYIIATIVLIVYCRGKSKSKKPVHHPTSDSIDGKYGNGDIEANVMQMKEITQLDEDIYKMQYPVENIEALTVIGKGEFGNVFLSKAPGVFPDLDEDDILVMVKSFDHNESDSDSLRKDFNREINTLHRANHDNIAKLLAISSESNDGRMLRADYLITEYLEWGILKLCLHASKDAKISKFSKNQKMTLCHQISCGLEHLKDIGIVHRDVSTRNCLISSQLHVKLSMISLSKEGFQNEYYEVNGRVSPIRWMAPESIFSDYYTFKSDVWAFGVTCWEVFSLGNFPYGNLNDAMFLKEMRSEASMPKLPSLDSSRRITSLINKCCQRLPSDRPDIRQIARKLHSITTEKEKETQAIVNNHGDSNHIVMNGIHDDVITEELLTDDEK